MTLQERITLVVQVAGPTLAVLTFLTTYRSTELRAVVEDERSKPRDYWRESIICTALPVLSTCMAAFTWDTAADSWARMLGGRGFEAPLALFVLMYVLLLALLAYQVLLAFKAWAEWTNRK